ncbi:hypothetical protein MSAN_02465400 [Mycena sanguinolenta]|uniref:Uncharacterized protein n=1 Tax=Mycena sanguinolenta TaxID=230812 RepID=A0A8H6WX66_9AGAR|nr:hypothetical protein MSAN_02465400 [Mycena sanguinolenta]
MSAYAGPSTSHAQGSFLASASAGPSSPRKRKRTQNQAENAHPAVTRPDDDEEEEEEAPLRKKALLEKSANVQENATTKGGKGKGKSRGNDVSEKKSRGGGRKKKEGDEQAESKKKATKVIIRRPPAISSEERQTTLASKNAERRVARREHARENPQAAIEQRLESGRNRSPTVYAWWLETTLDTAKRQRALHQAVSQHRDDSDLALVPAVVRAFSDHEGQSAIPSDVWPHFLPNTLALLADVARNPTCWDVERHVKSGAIIVSEPTDPAPVSALQNYLRRIVVGDISLEIAKQRSGDQGKTYASRDVLVADAWIAKAARSVVQGIDLFKNRVEFKPLGALDGRVAAYVELGRTAYFITTHANYVPLLPQIDPKQIVLRRDMRYGHDDPVLWPQLYSDAFCHLAAIPKAPTSAYDRAKIGVMWWNPTPKDFTQLSPFVGIMPSRKCALRRIWAVSTIPSFAHPAYPTLPQLVQTLRLSLERLTIPATYTRMQLGVVAVQREYRELTGLLRYMTKYKPRMDGLSDPDANPANPDDCLGCFTDDPRVAQIFWKACLPCWFIRPLQAFANENILKIVVPFVATDFLEMVPADGFPPVPTTDRLEDRLRVLHKCTRNTSWYRNPLLVASASTSAPANPRPVQQSGPSRGTARDAAARALAKAQKEAKGPNPNAKTARDKFMPLDRPEMPSIITAWAAALAAIDRSCPPSCGVDLPQRYVLPEPALLASPEDELRRRTYYHHYRLMRDALMFRLADPTVPPVLLSTQEWRDVLQGKVIAQGKAGTRAQQRSATVEDLLRPAFEACGIDALTEFLVPPNVVPPIHLHSAKELLWELAEMNFRYEFLALDARASGLDRPDECRRCFAGNGMIGLDFRESQRGLAAAAVMDRLPYLLCAAGLMRDWSVPCERPQEIDSATKRIEWDAREVRLLERQVATFYTQSFYEVFGRAAVIPMRLEHEIGS